MWSFDRNHSQGPTRTPYSGAKRLHTFLLYPAMGSSHIIRVMRSHQINKLFYSSPRVDIIDIPTNGVLCASNLENIEGGDDPDVDWDLLDMAPGNIFSLL